MSNRALFIGRIVSGPFLLLVYLLTACCPSLFALNPELDIFQYSHTSWRVHDGFSRGTISAIAQTPDGYLWLATEFGLLRFDGVRTVPWTPPGGEPLPGNPIFKLFVSRDGTLWIGTFKGVASWKDGKLTQYPQLAGFGTFALVEDHQGTIWVGTFGIPTARLCAIRSASVQCYGEDGSLGAAVLGMYEDSKGNLWVGVKDGLWHWRPGPPKYYALPGELNGIRAFGEDEDGTLLIGRSGGILRFVDGKTEPFPLSNSIQPFQAERLLRDRQGGLWIATDRDLLHVHQGKTDLFAVSDGLSGEHVSSLLEDQEGNIWATTYGGLDRFRDYAVPTYSEKQGMSKGLLGSVLADKDGSVWLSTSDGLQFLKNGQITSFGEPHGKLNGSNPNSLFQDSRGRVWVSTHLEFGYLENNKFVAVKGVKTSAVHGITEDSAGGLWIADQNYGLYQLSSQGKLQQISWAALGHQDHATALISDRVHGGLWVGFYLGAVAFFRDGQLLASYSLRDGLGEGMVNDFWLEPDGTPWVANESGFSRIKDGHVATLSSKTGLPCDGVHWALEDDHHSLWLFMPCGLVRLDRHELDAWTSAVDQDHHSNHQVHVTVLDTPDGVRSRALSGGYRPLATKSPDGKLWFTTFDGASFIDPRRLSFNNLPPPVHVENITADRKTYDADSQLRLPPLVRGLQINYTGLSFIAPEKVLFRYKLEGLDNDWEDAGTRRQAFYTNLPPRHYRFRVMASNNSGVWNETGASVDFSIAPAYYQALWFRLSSAAAFVLFLWGLYYLRLRQTAREFTMHLEGRVSERLRIARELHDTLLQTFQAVLLRFQAASNLFSTRPKEAKEKLDNAIDMAAQAITEGRDAVQGLRISATETNDLAAALTALGRELASHQTEQISPVFDLEIEGTSVDLHPILRDEVYRIAGEAIRNAFRHAQAHRIELEIHYDRRQLRLRIRDDGKGITPQSASNGGHHGHFGLHGMHERANLVGGRLEVWSKPDSGTEVELTIPAAAAYSSLRARWVPWRSERETILKS